jgi:hypothetical protein
VRGVACCPPRCRGAAAGTFSTHSNRASPRKCARATSIPSRRRAPPPVHSDFTSWLAGGTAAAVFLHECARPHAQVTIDQTYWTAVKQAAAGALKWAAARHTHQDASIESAASGLSRSRRPSSPAHVAWWGHFFADGRSVFGPGARATRAACRPVQRGAANRTRTARRLIFDFAERFNTHGKCV